jgi:AAA+ ATPase superfamily predicted ATPase
VNSESVIKWPWGFYGRAQEANELASILARRRWFFVQVTGRRRIGKTALIQEGLRRSGLERTLYIQIPDSDPIGVLNACNEYLETFGLSRQVRSLKGLAELLGSLVRDGWVVALDEFQYFNRKPLYGFCSYLQAEVDALTREAAGVKGGLIVLGSLHNEMTALLEDRAAPLYNRTTDVIRLGHLDVESILDLLEVHADLNPERFLFLWNLFEGVPKFYRDAYERDVLGADRADVLNAMYFSSSSPLRGEAQNWFLGELRGRYDMILQFVARHPGCNHADLLSAISELSPQEGKQAGGYLKHLTERYGMVARRLPVFAKPQARLGRYYIVDNFLRSWMVALQRPVSAIHFRPVEQLVEQADRLLADAEGFALEDLAGRIYEERSRKGLGEFPLSQRIDGYWDRAGVELDLVAISENTRRIRFGTCKRNAVNLMSSLSGLFEGAKTFLLHHKQFADWQVEYCAIAPSIPKEIELKLKKVNVLPESLADMLKVFKA